MIAIVDYGVGNLFSLKSSVAAIGQQAQVTASAEEILSAQRIILPGVGAFGDAAQKLRALKMDETLKKAVGRGTPLLGICLGMQLLFEESYEFGRHEGLGLIKGAVRPIGEVIPQGLKIPQIGWNALEVVKPSPIFKYLEGDRHVYFVHSYHATGCDKALTAVTDYGAKLTAAVQAENVFGCQFHPEKSGPVGLGILRAFCEVNA